MKLFVIIFYFLFFSLSVAGQSRVTGRVSGEDGQPLPGATIKIAGSHQSTIADSAGRFFFDVTVQKLSLEASFVGFKTRSIIVNVPSAFLNIVLEIDGTFLKEVVVSTGYQSVSRQHTTGSFIQIDQKLLNKRVSPDIISRLENLSPGLVFNRGRGSNPNDISIRGQSTIFANAQPLIVLDHFPFTGDLNSINPNDVESITVLKDAAAAAIWGSRAGNGVIVITTRKGKLKKPLEVSFNSNVTLGEKPNLFYEPVMSSGEYIDMERKLFQKGYYNGSPSTFPYLALTPVVELLYKVKDGIITSEEADKQIEAFKQNDIRRDFEKYYYRQSVNRQYAINLNGGGESQAFNLSLGYDYNSSNLVGNSYKRLTLNGSNTYSFLKDKLNLSAGIYYTEALQVRNNDGPGSVWLSDLDAIYPYARLADEKGTALPLIRDYRDSFKQTAQDAGLLSWQYNPLEELASADNKSNLTEYRIDSRLKYAISRSFSGELLYQFSRGHNEGRNYQGVNSYYTRNLINRYTQLTSGSIVRNIPFGSILDVDHSFQSGHNLRGQFNYNNKWVGKHALTALAGAEMRTHDVTGTSARWYGYNDDLATSATVDYLTRYPQFYNPASTLPIANGNDLSSLADRFLSLYSDATYTFLGRYMLSASGRLDQSNLFGVRANQKGVPLWSAGVGWSISDEPFYRYSAIPYLKVRATYGYNGNINKSVSAYTTATVFSNSIYSRLPYAVILNPPNPELRWERVNVLNAGLDFSTRNNILTGSIEYYQKQGIDLIGGTLVAPSSGVTSFRGNTASIKGNGVDVLINTKNVDGKIMWGTNLIFSYNKDRITDYHVQATGINYTQSADLGNFPMVGRPLYSIFSYKSAGLDPLTGDPQGYLNGVISKDYTGIINNTEPVDLIYHGPSRPVFNGAIRNIIEWKNFSFSGNVSYRLGYYFRRPSVRYGTVLSGNGGHGDYRLRWQKQGDEVFTNVPSMPASSSTNRDNLYLYSNVLVERGDHFRLQDLHLSYSFNSLKGLNLPVKRVNIYVYVNNLGILWKANDAGIDPDYASGPPPATFAAGFKLDL